MENEVCERCRPLFEQLARENQELRQRIEVLERRLLAYENAHTPPSLRYKRRLPPAEGGRRGAPEGHRSGTRPEAEPTMRVELLKEKCDRCSATLGKPFWVERRIIEEIPEPQPIEVTEYRIPHYLCSSCGTHVSADAPGLGRFGPRTCAQVALLKFTDRLPHALVARALERQFGLELTPPTVLSITSRVANATRKRYERLRAQLLRSHVVHIDETELRVAGRTYWTWVFCTNGLTLYAIRPTRGKSVVEDVLAGYTGIAVTDGYRIYNDIGSAHQRCWAHLLRDAEWLAQQHDTAKPVLEQLRAMYHELKALAKRAHINRQAAYDSFVLRMRQLIDLCGAYREMHKFATTLRNGIHSWFIALLYPGVPLTNNLAERQLREIVVQRKIFGTLRTDKGTHTMETLMSLLMSWKQRGKNALKELTRILRAYPSRSVERHVIIPQARCNIAR